MENNFTNNYNEKIGEQVSIKNQNQDYASWADAWAKFKEKYPDGTYRVYMFENPTEYGIKKVPYFVDENFGVMVGIELSLGGDLYLPPVLLPVLDSKKKVMKTKRYEYIVKENTKVVEAADMADINRAIMRCLVKAVAIHTGIGLELWSKQENMQLDPEITEQEIAHAKDRMERLGLSTTAMIKAVAMNLNKTNVKSLNEFTESMYRYLSHQLDLMEESPSLVADSLKKKEQKKQERQEQFTVPEFVAANQ